MTELDNLSVVVQGPVAGNDGSVTKALLVRLRDELPSSELILSTWKGQGEKATIEECRLIESEDPGNVVVDGVANNVDRQVVSSRNGVQAATRPFVLKLRADLRVFDGAKLRHSILKSIESSSHSDLGTPGRVTVTHVTSVNPSRFPIWFALCDWIYLGRRSELTRLFECPSFSDHVQLGLPTECEPRRFLNAEQWIAANYVANHVPELREHIKNNFACIRRVEQLHSEFVRRYFDMRSLSSMGLASTKYPPFYFSRDKMYSDREWRHFAKTGESKIDPLSQLEILLAFLVPRTAAAVLPTSWRKTLRSIVSRRVYNASN